MAAAAWCRGGPCKQPEAVAPTFWVLDSLFLLPLFTPTPPHPAGDSLVKEWHHRLVLLWQGKEGHSVISTQPHRNV